ncbi:dienelactone hydrolase family protein [Nocardia thailandica]|uniref:dienelactone hydrolase family protein n=1 Tax=Nocardia thailandica TaxID=257275 RepID=UPI0005B859B5|nr:dienelactone hydrolase family protein [Nocardia thailandica]
MSGSYTSAAPLRGADETTAGAGSVPITVIEPERTARGGIVVLHESREFPPALQRFMVSLAGEGWIVVAPHLFHRVDDDNVHEVFGQELFDDFDAGFDWLRRRGVFPDTVGVLGFDTAGTAAFLVATNRSIGAAVSVAAPGIVTPLPAQDAALVDIAGDLQAPWLGLFGADDPATPADEVDRLREAAAAATVATLTLTFPGLAHRPDSRADSDGDGVDAQTRIYDWFDSNLR